MTDFENLSDPEELPEDIVEWQPHQGHLIGNGRMDGTVVAAATVGALAALGLVAGAFLAGRASGKRA